MFPVHERKRTKYVGRTEEFSLMEGILNEVRSGKGKLVMLEGEAGIGKTRFTEELGSLDVFSSFRFLKGRCLYFKDTDVYLPFKEMFNQYWEMRSKARGETPRSPFVDEDDLSDSGVVLKEEDFLPMSLIPAEMEIEQIREEMPVEGLMRYDKMSQFIFNLAEDSPVCLLIDDLHWADPASLQMLYYLAQKIVDQRIFIICTFRPEDLFWGGEETHPLADALKRFERDHLYIPVKLNRLTKAETKEVLTSILQVEQVPKMFSDLIYARTLGNPFFVEEVLYSLLERGVIETGSVESLRSLDIDSISLPSNLKDVIQRRVHWLKPVSIKVVRFASVSGESFSFDIIKEALELRDEDIIEALEELSLAKFIVEAKEEERYEFENPVIQEVIYSELNQSRRRFLHNKMAKVMEERFSTDPSLWANIALHYYKGKDFEKALKYLTKASTFYQNIAPQRALEYLHLVLDCIERLPQSDAIKSQNMDVLIEISNLCLQAGDLKRSMEFAEKALNLASVLKNTRATIRSKLNIADIFRHRGDLDTSMRYYEDTIRLSQQEDNYEGMANAYMGIGYLHWRRGDFPRSLEMFSKSLQYAKVENNLRTIGRLYFSIGDLFQQRGDLEKAIDYYRRGVKHLETVGDSLLVSTGLSNIANVHIEMDDLEAAEEELVQALDKAKEQGRPDLNAPHLQLMRLRSLQGRYDDARSEYDLLMETLENQEDRVLYALTSMCYADCMSRQGHHEGPENLLDLAVETFSNLDVPYELGNARLLQGDHFARKGEFSLARDSYQEGEGLFRSIGAKSRTKTAEELIASLKSK